MQRVRFDFSQVFDQPWPVVAIGNLDGVHLGHQRLLAAAIDRARQAQGTAVAMTFDPHPSRFTRSQPVPALMTETQKEEVIERLGIDVMLVVPFNEDLRRLEPQDFVAQLLTQVIGARVLIVGENFRFGRDRAGDLALLRKLGQAAGIEVHGIEPVLAVGQVISSTRIRAALMCGEMAAANAMLGRSFFIDGEVVPGDQRGRTLGFATANLATANEVTPAEGVYAARCRIAGHDAELAAAPLHPAVVNIGRRPTFGGHKPVIEAHLLEDSEVQYGRRLRLVFVERLRDEHKFASAAELREQIQKDVARARRLLE
ncbi:MAG: bifunctional riboflavin kinase/FAD synthetase [Vicinamibacteria bacterium]|jgi:riboflavin kinase/FMN adenylyltransferase|nr:bifunctional riboflavin kinase/FAD synthetase [Vicinamibacteria bacterium]